MTEEETVSELNFSIKKQNLLMVIGKIGSGKTTLLHSIMEESKKVKGELKVNGRIGYVE